MSYPQALNSYSYGLNNPLRFNDPTGKSASDVIVGGVSGFVAAVEGLASGIVNSIFHPIKTIQNIPNIPRAIGEDLKQSGQMIIRGNDLERGFGITYGSVILGTLISASETSIGNVSRLERLSDSALVCRGGSCTAERFTLGNAGPLREGKLTDVSVQSASGVSEGELAKNLPQSKVGTTTVGQIRA